MEFLLLLSLTLYYLFLIMGIVIEHEAFIKKRKDFLLVIIPFYTWIKFLINLYKQTPK